MQNTFDQFIQDIDENLQSQIPGNEPNGDQPLDEILDVQMINNGWNDKNERILISIGENSASYKWMHERSASVQRNVHIALSITNIILSTGLSAETVLTTSQSTIVTELRRVCVYLVTVISVLQTFLNSQKLSEQHLMYAGEFSKLYHDIQQHMCTYRRHRPPATKYVSECLKQYDSLVVKGPDINQLIVKQFKRNFGNSEISVPAIADRIQKIEIVAETTKSNDIQPSNSKSVNCNNLHEIHNIFQINGDITDKDIKDADETKLRQLKKKIQNERMNFEYHRFREHSRETD
ncbi:MAG: SLATT domain-containing protein [Proteobacteria bacterium]|nr:SLATT domain-containing protein [Pseudomonadota bacterium]